jgi:cytochrome c553
MRLALVVILLLAPRALAADDDAGAQFFESRIRPLLVDRCYSCHSASAKKLKAGLYLDSQKGLLKGGESGPALVPGAPEKSRLIEAVEYKNVDLQMPPKEKLGDQQIADLTQWVKMGAPWGKDSAPAAAVAKVETFDLQKRKAQHWAWQPVADPKPPASKDADWPRDPIDQFVLAKLDEKNLRPAAPADRRTLLRRVHFDLIGLPPAPHDVEDFVNDPDPNALAGIVDRLLASPRFGERWGRHWLDLVRYSETMGHEFDFPIPNAWRYRDYVIRALNADLPVDRFLTEQVAGDLLDKPRRLPSGDNESILGTAFWLMGEDVQAPVDVRQHQADLMDNRIDVLGKSMQGLTIACARCHDHKFDAIAAADYYALYGYAKGARYTQAIVNETAIAAHAERLKELKTRIRRTTADAWLSRVDEIAPKLPPSAGETFPTRSDDVELLAGRMSDWRLDGPAFTAAAIGDFTPGPATRPVTRLITTPAFTSSSLSAQLQGHLRSPAFPITKRYLHLRAAGQGARVNLVIENFVVIRDPIYGGLKKTLKHELPTWLTFDLSMWQGRQAYVEIADTTVNDPGGPASPADAWASLTHATLSDQPKPPHATPLKPEGDAAELLRTTIELWRDDRLAAAPDAAARAGLLGAVIGKGLLDDSGESVATLLNEYRDVEKSLPAPTFALAATDADAGDEAVFIRGNPRTLGPTVPRRFLEALPSSALSTHHSSLRSSSRLALAAHIASKDNPLTARVYVNRVWHHLFGSGLVPSVDNFGLLGERPSHPQLLDHLATRFVRDGWSTKRLIRAIVLSRTYQMSSRSADDMADAADPTDALLHRANVRRLEAETIRDHLLAVSGRLDLTAGGPSVPIHLTPFMEGRGKPTSSGPLDGAGRRSVYIEVRRNFIPPMLLAFDTPTPFNTMGRRTVSNVPAQALILMNDPFVLEQARLWAKRVLAVPDATAEERITGMYAAAFSRPPTGQELGGIKEFLSRQGQNESEVWTQLAHALINTKEFIFVN